jgi:RNA polymerase sigma-70 factor (ECF subfamily)
MEETDRAGAGALVERALRGEQQACRELTDRLLAPRADREMIDAALDRLARAARDDPAGPGAELLIEQLYSQPFVRAEIRRFLVDDEQAADVLQETLLAVTRGLPSFRGDSLVRTWTTSIARNQAISAIRRRMERTAPGHDLAGDLESARFSSLLADREDLRAAMGRLPPMFADVVRLRDIDRMPYAEIATKLDIELNTVRSRLARGRARLAVMVAAEA